MLTALGIENFKAFGLPQRVPLRPITLVFGPNSSGKSSLIHALLLLKQTLDEAEQTSTVLLPKGKLLDLGSFSELVFRHDTERRLRLSMEVDVSRFRAAPHGMPVETTAGLQFEFDFSAEDGIALSSVSLTRPHDGEVLLRLEPSSPVAGDEGRARRMLARQADRVSRRASRSRLRLCATEVTKDATVYEEAFEASLVDPRRADRQQFLRVRIEETRAMLDRAKHMQVDFEAQLMATKQELEKKAASSPSARDREILESSLAELQEQYEAQRHHLEDLAQRQRELQSEDEGLRRPTLKRFVTEQVDTQRDLEVLLEHFLPVRVVPRADEQGTNDSRRTAEMRSRRTQRGRSASVLSSRLTAASDSVREALRTCVYLGPLREYPERHYLFSGNLAENVGKSGKSMPELLFTDDALVAGVNEWMAKFDMGYSLEARRVNDPNVEGLFLLRLTDKVTKIDVSPLDVGVGISQVLPIIVQSLLSVNSLICIEQPEIHLHPRLQAELGSLLASTIGEPNANQYIIETHSEHLILRLQRLVRSGQLQPNDVAVLHVDKTNDGSIVRELRMSKSGRFIDRWPHGFFEEGFNERFGE